MDIQKRFIRIMGLAALLSPMFLAGCAAPGEFRKGPRHDAAVAACTADCRLDVVLPPQSRRPELPPGQQTLRVRGDSNIAIRKQGPGDVLLVFELPAFVDANGKPLYTVMLRPGNNAFKTLPAGSCPPCGCKYTIVDPNDPNRPPLDPWIIIDPY